MLRAGNKNMDATINHWDGVSRKENMRRLVDNSYLILIGISYVYLSVYTSI